MKTFSVYYLLDPIDRKIRYVGYSRNPKKRYEEHVLQSPARRTHKECWIASLIRQNLLPVLSVRCIVQEANEAKRIEVALISALKSQGIELTNSTVGGDGSAGFTWSEENYAKHEEYWNSRQEPSPLKGRRQTKEHIEATKAANTPELLSRRGEAIKMGWARRNGAPTKKKGKPSGRQPSLGKTWTLTDEQKQHQRASWTPERRSMQSERMRRKRALEVACK